MVMSGDLREGGVSTANRRNGWGPGGSNPKASQPCWHVYVVDLAGPEMGPFVDGGTGRLPPIFI